MLLGCKRYEPYRRAKKYLLGHPTGSIPTARGSLSCSLTMIW